MMKDDDYEYTTGGEHDQIITRQWIAGECIDCTLLTIVFYVACMLFFNQHRHGECLQRNQTLVKRYKCLLDWLTTIGSVIFLVKLILSVESVWGRGGEVYCNYISLIATVFGKTAYGILYLAFWVRQRVFYHVSSLYHLTSKTSRVLSVAILPVFILGYITHLTLYFTFFQHAPNPSRGCEAINGDEAMSIIIGLAVFGMFMQAALVSLFIYPLYKSRNPSQAQTKDDVQLALMKRVIICFVVSMISYMTGFLLEKYAYHKIDRLMHSMYNVCIFIWLIGAVLSFQQWRSMLMPCFFSEPHNSLQTSGRAMYAVYTNSTKEEATRQKLEMKDP